MGYDFVMRGYYDLHLFTARQPSRRRVMRALSLDYAAAERQEEPHI